MPHVHISTYHLVAPQYLAKWHRGIVLSTVIPVSQQLDNAHSSEAHPLFYIAPCLLSCSPQAQSGLGVIPPILIYYSFLEDARLD